MNTTTVTIAAVFCAAILLAVPLGWLFRIEPKEGRYTHIDGMRAAAALMVVCSHYLTHAGLIMGEPVSAPLRDAFGAVGVQIFFSITGFLFICKVLKGPVNIGELAESRVRRIVPLYLVAMTAAVAVAIHIIRAAHQATPVLYADLARAYAYGFFVGAPPSVAGMSIAGQAGQMWTLAWEWRFYVLVPFLGLLAARRAWILPALVVVIGCAIADQTNGILPPWVFFLPGMACAVGARHVKLGDYTGVVLTVVGAAAFVLSLALNIPANGIAQAMLCLVGFPCLLFGHPALLSIKPLRLLGEVSYSIYMWHLVVASLFWTYVQSDTNWMLYKTPADRLPLAAGTLVGLFVLSFVSYAAIERPFIARTNKQPAAPVAAPVVG